MERMEDAHEFQLAGQTEFLIIWSVVITILKNKQSSDHVQMDQKQYCSHFNHSSAVRSTMSAINHKP